MVETDVLIVGGGPSGASLGYLLQKNGIRNCIVEKCSFPRNKLCGGLLTQKTVGLIEKIYGGTDFPYECVSSHVNLFFGTELISSVRTESRFYLVERRDFDSYLADCYRSVGGTLLENAELAGIDFKTGTASTKGGDEIRFKAVVGADGANSMVRKYVDKNYRPNAVCVEASSYSDRVPDTIGIYFSAVRAGYGWCFPKKGRFAVGIGGVIEKNGNIRDSFEAFAEKIGKPCSRSGVRGALIPFGRYVRVPCGDRVLLIGDAAGLVDPVTGEGIYFALYSALCAYRALSGWLRREEPLCRTYLKDVKEIHKRIRDANRFNRLFSDAAKPFFLRLIKGRTHIAQYVCDNLVSNYNVSYSSFIPKYLKAKRLRKKNG